MSKRGRPPSITQEIEQEVFARIAAGESITSIFSDPKMPCEKTFYNHCGNHEKFLQASLRARGLGSHALADQCIEIADDSKMEAHDKRVRIDTRMRLMGHWNKQYDQKQTHRITGADGEGPVESEMKVTFVNATK